MRLFFFRVSTDPPLKQRANGESVTPRGGVERDISGG
jgi:hypothetical protein